MLYKDGQPRRVLWRGDQAHGCHGWGPQQCWSKPSEGSSHGGTPSPLGMGPRRACLPLVQASSSVDDGAAECFPVTPYFPTSPDIISSLRGTRAQLPSKTQELCLQTSRGIALVQCSSAVGCPSCRVPSCRVSLLWLSCGVSLL